MEKRTFAGLGRWGSSKRLGMRSTLAAAGMAIGTFWASTACRGSRPEQPATVDMGLKAEAGITIGATDGTKRWAGGGVEEVEAGTADIWSGRLQFSVPMQ